MLKPDVVELSYKCVDDTLQSLLSSKLHFLFERLLLEVLNFRKKLIIKQNFS